MESLKGHRAVWTAESIQKFWDWCAANPHLQRDYFSNVCGRGIVNFLSATGMLSGKVLDFGCGSGYLCEHLLSEKVECWGADSSAASVRRANERCQGRANWHGAIHLPQLPTPFEPASFEVVTCVEVLEHLPDEALRPVLEEIKRLLKSTGVAFFSTPFAEDLQAQMIFCPFCETEFHKVQHLRSLTIESLRRLLESHGMNVLFCQNLDFEQFQQDFQLPSWRHWSIEVCKWWLRDRCRKTLDRWLPRPFPLGRDFQYRLSKGNGKHLCALAALQPSTPALETANIGQ